MAKIVIDVSTWTQTEKNHLTAAAVALLYQYDNSFDGHGITAKNGVIEIPDSLNPPVTLPAIWSASNLKNWITVNLEANRIASEAAQLEEAAKQAEIRASEFSDIKLSAIDAKVDAATNLTQLKAILKEFVRYVVAGS